MEVEILNEIQATLKAIQVTIFLISALVCIIFPLLFAFLMKK